MQIILIFFSEEVGAHLGREDMTTRNDYKN